jgi:lactoylglutathione lyase
MQSTQLNHVAIHVADVDKTVQFYRRVLLLGSIPRPAFTFPGAWMRLGADQELHIIGERDEPVIAGNRGNHFALMIDNMDTWETHLRQLNVEYLPRRIRPDGAYQIYVFDPDGHCIELCTAVGTAPIPD